MMGLEDRGLPGLRCLLDLQLVERVLLVLFRPLGLLAGDLRDLRRDMMLTDAVRVKMDMGFRHRMVDEGMVGVLDHSLRETKE